MTYVGSDTNVGTRAITFAIRGEVAGGRAREALLDESGPYF